MSRHGAHVEPALGPVAARSGPRLAPARVEAMSQGGCRLLLSSRRTNSLEVGLLAYFAEILEGSQPRRTVAYVVRGSIVE